MWKSLHDNLELRSWLHIGACFSLVIASVAFLFAATAHGFESNKETKTDRLVPYTEAERLGIPPLPDRNPIMFLPHAAIACAKPLDFAHLAGFYGGDRAIWQFYFKTMFRDGRCTLIPTGSAFYIAHTLQTAGDPLVCLANPSTGICLWTNATTAKRAGGIE